MRLRGPLLLLLGALLVSGCAGGEDEPTTTQAAKVVTAWMGPIETDLTRALQTLKPWQPTQDASEDQKSGCEDGTARRTYAATLDVSDRINPPEADSREALLVGQLSRRAVWDPYTSSNDDTTGTVRARRVKTDPTGTRLTIGFSPVPGGWHYDITARTACLPTS